MKKKKEIELYLKINNISINDIKDIKQLFEIPIYKIANLNFKNIHIIKEEKKK